MIRSLIKISLILVIFQFFFISKATALEAESVVVGARVIELEEIINDNGIEVQTVKGEILSGEFKSTVQQIVVPIDSGFIRPLEKGDEIKIKIVELDSDYAFQFYDYARTSNYIWILLLFVIFLAAFGGSKGLQRLIPAIVFTVLLAVGFIPDWLDREYYLLWLFLLLSIIAGISAYIRLKNKTLVFVVVISTLVCLGIGTASFISLSQVSNVFPFVTFPEGASEVSYQKIMDFMIVGAVIIASGAVINSTIQLIKHLIDQFEKRKEVEVKTLLKEGFHATQRIATSEVNSLVLVILGSSIAGMYFISTQDNLMPIWEHGWVVLNIITIISSGISILLVTPISVLFISLLANFNRVKLITKTGQIRIRNNKTD